MSGASVAPTCAPVCAPKWRWTCLEVRAGMLIDLHWNLHQNLRSNMCLKHAWQHYVPNLPFTFVAIRPAVCAKRVCRKGAPEMHAGSVRWIWAPAGWARSAPRMCAENLRPKCAPRLCAEIVRRKHAPENVPKMCAENVRRNCAPEMCAEIVRRNCAPKTCAEKMRRKCAP